MKIEDQYAFANMEGILKVPGIAVGEGGPGDMALSLGLKSSDSKVKDREDRIFAAAHARKIFWNGINRNDAIEKIKEGYMIGFGREAAETARKFTNRSILY